jgi:hypothetical protein
LNNTSQIPVDSHPFCVTDSREASCYWGKQIISVFSEKKNINPEIYTAISG